MALHSFHRKRWLRNDRIGIVRSVVSRISCESTGFLTRHERQSIFQDVHKVDEGL